MPPLLPTIGSAFVSPVSCMGVRRPSSGRAVDGVGPGVSGTSAGSRSVVSVATTGGVSETSEVVSRTTTGSPLIWSFSPGSPAERDTGATPESPKGRAGRQADGSSSRQSPGSSPSAAMAAMVTRPEASDTEEALPERKSCWTAQPSLHSETKPSSVTEPFLGSVPRVATRSSPVASGT